MAITAGFVVKNPGAPILKPIKFYDISYEVGVTSLAWSWAFGDLVYWTVSAPPSTHLNIVNADTYYTVGERVGVGGVTLPAGLNPHPYLYWVKTVTTTYIELSLTSGGAAITYTDAGSGTFYAQHGSSLQNPTFIYHPTNTSSAKHTISLGVYGSDGNWYDTSRLATYSLGSAYFSDKPTTDIYNRTSVFLYNGDNATLINRNQTTNNNLLFTELTCTGAINRAGTATITILDVGDSTATEQSLISNGYTTETNVAILVGYDIVWSGRILRATQSKMSQYDETTTIKQWKLECESDISKLVGQTISTSFIGDYFERVGFILNLILQGPPSWQSRAILSDEGPKIKYRVPPSPKDSYTMFIELMRICGFDWRTQLNTRRFNFGSYVRATKIITVSALYDLTVDAFIGGWIIFIDPTQTYPTAYGRITDNDANTITCTTITNSTVPPEATLSCVVLLNPRVDRAIDISEPYAVATFTMNQSESAVLYNGYEFDDKTDKKSLFTKITANSKDRFLDKQNTVTVAATTKWDEDSSFFEHSSHISYTTEGWVKSGTNTSSSLYIYGWNYALQVDDLVDIVYYDTAGAATIESFHIHAASQIIDEDGMELTQLTLNTALTHTYPKGTFLTCRKLYFKDTSLLSTGTITRIGAESVTLRAGGSDAIYGGYLTTNGISDRGENSTVIYPHVAGCIAIDDTYTEASPQAESPIAMHGVINKTTAVDTLATLSELDIYATQHIIQESAYYKRATFWCHPYDFSVMDIPSPSSSASTYTEHDYVLRFLKEGQRISVTTTTGDTPEEFQIVDWTYTANDLRVDVTLGDFDRNIFTLLGEKTNALTGSIL